MTNYTTPLDAGTDVGDPIAGKLYGRTKLHDGSGVEAIGDVGASPGANTILGRLKAIVTTLTGGIGVTGAFWQATQPISAAALPLPAGAATQATAAALLTALQATVPAAIATAITPSDSTALTTTTRLVYVGVTGNLTATIGGNDVLFTAVPAGMQLPIVATKIKATGTTASGIVGLA